MPVIKDRSRRTFLKGLGAGLFLTGLPMSLPLPAWGQNNLTAGDLGNLHPPRSRYDLTFDYAPIVIDGREDTATAINGTVPGPLVRLREGDEVELNVTNSMMDTEHASIHWHGVLVPFRMDGVPGVNFDGIQPGETYKYRFKVHQAGTYWYHSHSFFQEQTGGYAPLIIDPRGGEPWDYDRDYTVVLSDWAFEDPNTIFRHLNLMADYYNFQQYTVDDLFEDYAERGFWDTVADRMAWGKMRMSPVDLLGVTGHAYTYLMNGNSPDMNWTAIFNPGETIRLRFINASAMTNFDVRIPEMNMDVVMADGKPVRPVNVHEFRIGVAETYDVLVRPTEDKPFTIFAESLDRSGYTRGTLSPEPGLEAPVPPLRPRPERRLRDVGMGKMDDRIIGGIDPGEPDTKETAAGGKKVTGPTPGQEQKPTHHDPRIPGPNGPEPFHPKKERVNVAMVVKNPKYRLDEPGIGLGSDGWRVLTYDDLVSDAPQIYSDTVDREMTINITANMGKYMFSFDGKKFTEQPGPYFFRHNERLRLFLVNHTMMEHPIHLHGMWMQLENGADRLPFKHTILTKPGGVLSVLITPIEKGDWAFHCHLLYHFHAGMWQIIRVA